MGSDVLFKGAHYPEGIMRAFSLAMLMVLPVASLANTGDSAESIRINVAPAADAPAAGTIGAEPDAAPTYFRPSLSIPELPQTSGHPLVPPTLWSLRPYSLGDSLDPMEKAIAGFPEFWAQVERENDIDDLRWQLGMGAGQGAFRPGSGRIPLAVTPSGGIGLEFVSLGSWFYRAWQERKETKAKEERFQSKVRGLIQYTQELRAQKGDSPAISIILAKLHFMGERAGKTLPVRNDRKIFTESLRAWAVHPVFDTTLLGSGLIELCRAYEEYEP
jgi:hypothetical protein